MQERVVGTGEGSGAAPSSEPMAGTPTSTPPKSTLPTSTLGPVGRILIAPAVFLIRIYQCTLSRLMPNICRFEPSCSHYSLGAYRTHGVVKGTGLTLWRLMRCQPFSKGGFDPVPIPSVPPRDTDPGSSVSA